MDTAILSHLHQDHIGGLRELAGSELLVSAAEWAELTRPAPELRGFLRSQIELPGLSWRRVSLEPASDPALAPFTESLDVMGDGSLVLLPTPGHTAGSVSLLVRRTGRPPLLLAGDLTYGAEILQRGQVPGVGQPAAARGKLAPGPGSGRATAGPGRAARSRPNRRPAAAR